jgi:uncharacterized membrane protein SpoIIM required for sporulation
MDVDRFTRERAAGWEELASLVRQAGSRPQGLGAERLLALGRRYRSAAADLALARRLFPHDPQTRRLERLVADARQSVYATEARRRSVVDFLTTGYWQRVRERPLPLIIALVLMFVPIALSAVWAIDDPAAALGLVPAQFEDAADPSTRFADLTAEEAAAMSSAVFTNNIQVTFFVIAAGVLFGVGSAIAMLIGCSYIGPLIGLTIENGQIGELLRFILSHGLLELSCIAVACSAGLRLGWSIVDPGNKARGAALREAARPAMEIVIGTMPWLVLAGVIEGFVSPAHPPLWLAATIGVLAAGTFWTLVIVRGRPDREHQARPLALSLR